MPSVLVVVLSVLAAAVVIFAVLLQRARREAARGGSWLPGVPAPAARLQRSVVLGHLKHFATSVPKKHGVPDTLGGQRVLFASADRNRTDLRGHASRAEAAAAAATATGAGAGGTGKTDDDNFFAGQLPTAGLTAFWFMRHRAIAAVRGDHVRKLLKACVGRMAVPLRSHHVSRALGTESLVMVDSTDVELWKTHRKLVTRGFYAESLATMVPAMDDGIRVLVRSLRERAASPGDADKPLDLLEVVKMATLDVIGTAAFGTDFGCSRALEFSPVGRAFQTLLGDMTFRMAGANVLKPPLMFYSWPTARNRANAAARNTVRGAMTALVAERRRQLAAGRAAGTPAPNDALSLMLVARDGLTAVDGGGGSSASSGGGKRAAVTRQKKLDSVSEEALVDNLVTLLFGGFDTTSLAVSYALWELWQRPTVRQRLVDEVTAVLGAGGDGPSATVADVNSLPYTTAVLKETLRLYPSAPVTARKTAAPVDLGGGVPVVPAGTIVYLPLFLTQRSPLNWTDPERFDPERFLGRQREQEGGGGGGALDDETRSWLPFSAGKRDCVGRRFAMQEGVLLLARLAHAFEFEFPKGYDPDPVMTGPVLCPSTPMMATVRRRFG